MFKTSLGYWLKAKFLYHEVKVSCTSTLQKQDTIMTNLIDFTERFRLIPYIENNTEQVTRIDEIQQCAKNVKLRLTQVQDRVDSMPSLFFVQTNYLESCIALLNCARAEAHDAQKHLDEFLDILVTNLGSAKVENITEEDMDAILNVITEYSELSKS